MKAKFPVELTVRFEGTTTAWDAERQMEAVRLMIGLLREIERSLTGKARIKWIITGMEKDD